MPTPRSVSQLKSYTRCGEAYRLEKVEEIPSKPGAWTVLGTGFHRAYQRWELAARSGQHLWELFPEEYDAAVEEAAAVVPLDEWFVRPRVLAVKTDIDYYREAGVKQAQFYEDHCRLSDWKLWNPEDGELMLEYAFDITLGGTRIRGEIDSVLEWPDGTLTIRDLKTGKLKKDSRQLGIYRTAIQKILGVDIQWGEYFYTKMGLARSGGWIDLTRYTEDYVGDVLGQLDQAINEGIFLPNPGDQCEMCGVRQHCREMGTLSVSSS